MTNTPSVKPASRLIAVQLWRAAGLAGSIAAIVNLIIFGLSMLIQAVPVVPLTPGNFSALSVVPLLLASFVPAIGATVALLVLRRFNRQPERTLSIVAVVIVLLSFFMPIQLLVTRADPRITLLSTLILLLMHVATAWIIVAGLVRQTIAKRQS
jgi:Family of unknown function (DUF6069)